MNIDANRLFRRDFRRQLRETGGMKFYRSPLDFGGFEYARVHANPPRVDYFDDELRVWITCESLMDEIFDDEDGMWTRCSEHEGEAEADVWPGAAFDLTAVVGQGRSA